MSENWVFGNDECHKDLITNYVSYENWILVGESGLGKFTMLKHFAKWLLPDPISDLRVLGRCSGRINVNSIRELREFASFGPSQGCWKIIILDAVNNMTYSAMNASLKLLEEHADYLLFFLTTNSLFNLRETLISRCKKLYFRKLTTDQMQNFAFLKALEVTKGDLILANGSPGYLLKLVEIGGREAYKSLLTAGVLHKSPPDIDDDFVRYFLQLFFSRVLRHHVVGLEGEIFDGELELIKCFNVDRPTFYERYRRFLRAKNLDAKSASILLW